MHPGKIINFTNHPSSARSKKQGAGAERYGTIVDYPFPATVLGQGEYSLAFAVAFLLRRKNVKVLAACSGRCVTETEESGLTKRESISQFVRFRELRAYL